MNRRSVQILLVSALTGSVVGAAISGVAAGLSGGDLVHSAAVGTSAGALIGLAASTAFLGLSLNARRWPVLSFLAVGPIVAAGTAAANTAAGVSSRILGLTVIAVSVVLAYVATVLWYRSYRRWNARLHEYQHANRE